MDVVGVAGGVGVAGVVVAVDLKVVVVVRPVGWADRVVVGGACRWAGRRRRGRKVAWVRGRRLTTTARAVAVAGGVMWRMWMKGMSTSRAWVGLVVAAVVVPADRAGRGVRGVRVEEIVVVDVVVVGVGAVVVEVAVVTAAVIVVGRVGVVAAAVGMAAVAAARLGMVAEVVAAAGGRGLGPLRQRRHHRRRLRLDRGRRRRARRRLRAAVVVVRRSLGRCTRRFVG